MNEKKRHRRSIRLKGYDYSQKGAYFITICTQNRECLFGDIADGVMRLNGAGKMIRSVWDGLPIRFSNMELDEFIIMPNHVHGVVLLNRRGESCIRPSCIRPNTNDHMSRPHGTLPGTLGRIMQAFKSLATHEYTGGVKQSGWMPFPGKLWQRNYWDRIIRDEPELNQIREYIINNPLTWKLDSLNPTCTGELQTGGHKDRPYKC